MYRLNNDLITVGISSRGAELQSLVRHDNGLEYMWSADPAFWAKTSPVLFPIVGGLKNNSYQYKGNKYSLGRHGFAREREFLVTAQSGNSVSFTLFSDQDTLRVYPFQFSFSVIYTLKQDTLTVAYEVTNTGNEPMYFSVGAHPAFAVPLVNGTKFTDHYLQFSEHETSPKWPLSSDGLILHDPIPFLNNSAELPLGKEVFYGDALVCKDLRSTAISIRNHVNAHGLTVNYEGFPYMGIWSFRDADFVCIEPWCGIADSVNTSGDITQKEGINELAPSQTFSRTWSVSVF